jgi:hypothetical protein
MVESVIYETNSILNDIEFHIFVTERYLKGIIFREQNTKTGENRLFGLHNVFTQYSPIEKDEKNIFSHGLKRLRTKESGCVLGGSIAIARHDEYRGFLVSEQFLSPISLAHPAQDSSFISCGSMTN